MMYYGFIILSVIMFGICFKLKDAYREMRGNSGDIKITLQYSVVSSAAGLVSLIMINGFKFEFTLFTLIMALLAAVNAFAFSFCSFKALGKINLSLYSLYSMLGGMALPFFHGILFFGENITVAKIVCVILITAALIVTVDKDKGKNGTIYYVGIFVLNGMSGVLSKIFSSADFAKTSAESYSIWICVCSIVISSVLLMTFFRNNQDAEYKNLPAAIALGAIGGIVNKIANLILVIALLHVDASVQYPMVTGGVMIVSTIICFFGKNKPSKKEILSVGIAFSGMLALFAIPV